MRFLKAKLSRKQDVMYAGALILSFLSVPLSCWASFFAIIEFGTGFHHLDRMTYNEELYQLALISNPGLGLSSYNLYQCDDLGLDCTRVYQLDTSPDTSHADLGDFQTAEQVRLTSSSSGQSISIVINGQSIYEYHP